MWVQLGRVVAVFIVKQLVKQSKKQAVGGIGVGYCILVNQEST